MSESDDPTIEIPRSGGAVLDMRGPSPRVAQSKPNVWLNCLWMAGPPLFTIATTFATGWPLAFILVLPGMIAGLINWLLSQSAARKQLWRSIFLGCFFSVFFLEVLASQWP